ncbi:RIO1 family regulatory kinase/ATPase [Paenibacillus puerhi]|uniref:RIO1 family regulatory kinase/ATPase n=1 Tax=Paenibacillus puerhi TaxID=2692622 RepID=UPI00135879B7|nr:RIO1 family regulatory kinase/ATPase [Paenibacillus puerhi]
MNKQQFSHDAVLIGRGKQGVVYRISPERCIKIYRDRGHARQEREAYFRAQHSKLIPRLYEAGPDYLIMEYVQGETMYRRLKRKKVMTRQEAGMLIGVLREMKRLEFTRCDIALFHILIPEEGGAKIIDLVHAYVKTSDVPRYLFKELERLRQLDRFVDYVKEMDPELLRDWHNYFLKRSERYGRLGIVQSER